MRLERVIHKGLPVTPVPQTVLDCAAHLHFRALRKMVAEVEYQRLASLTDLESVLRQGHPGSRALRRALAIHQPQLARVRSPLEEKFLYFCERHGIAMPLFNHEIRGFTVDAAWLAAGPPLIVELDSRAAHAIPARVEEDRRRDLVLRAAGFDIWRYTGALLEQTPSLIAAELKVRVGESFRRAPRSPKHAPSKQRGSGESEELDVGGGFVDAGSGGGHAATGGGNAC